MKNEIYNTHKASIGGLNANVMALLAYLISIPLSLIPIVRYMAWLAPLAVFLLEKQSKFVRFHAMQSFLLHLVSAAFSLLLSAVMIGIFGVGSISATTYYAAAGLAGLIGLFTAAISIAILIFAIIAMVGAYKYKETHIPVIGNIAQRITMK